MINFFNTILDSTICQYFLSISTYDIVTLNLIFGVTFSSYHIFFILNKVLLGLFPLVFFLSFTSVLYGQLSLLMVQFLCIICVFLFIYFILNAEMGWYNQSSQFADIKNKNFFFFNILNPAADASILLMFFTFATFFILFCTLIPSWYYIFVFQTYNFICACIYPLFNFPYPPVVLTSFWLVDLYTKYSTVFILSDSAFIVSYFITFLQMFIILCFSYIFWQLAYFCKVNKIQYYEYPFFVAFLLVACLLILFSTHLLILYILLELQGLCLILLISVSTLLTQSLQTGLRYALINIVGSLFFLYGIVRYVLLTPNSLFYIQLIKLNTTFYKLSFIDSFKDGEYSSADFHMFQFIENLINQGFFNFEDLSTPSWSIIPFLFIILGLCIKLGVGPFAFWVPNIYSSIHLLALIIFSTIPKLIYISILIFLISNNRVLFYINNVDILFLVMAIFSLIIGTFGLFKEKYSMFRFVGWSSIINFSLIILALSYSLKNINLIFYILIFINYYIISLLFFLGLFNYLNLTQKFSVIFVDLQLLVRNKELYPLVIIFISSLFSFFGIPPFLGFWGKLILLKGLVETSITAFDFIIISIFFLAVLIGGFTYIKLYNLIVSATYKDNTYFTLQPINLYRLHLFYLLFWFSQIIGFLYIVDSVIPVFIFN